MIGVENEHAGSGEPWWGATTCGIVPPASSLPRISGRWRSHRQFPSTMVAAMEASPPDASSSGRSRLLMPTRASRAVPLPLRSFPAWIPLPLEPNAAKRVPPQPAAEDPQRRVENVVKVPRPTAETTGNRSRFFGILRDFKGQSGMRLMPFNPLEIRDLL